MTRSSRRVLAAIITACFALLSSALHAAERPNILVFICDDLSARDLSCYGATDTRTPNIDALAASGLTFDHAFIVSPACAPSRAALLTGLYPERSGAVANHEYKRPGIASLPPSLNALGYQTAAFGKVTHGGNDNVNHGFTHAPTHNNLSPSDIAAWLSARDRSKPVCLFAGTHAPHVPWPANNGYDPARVNIPRFHIDTPETRTDRTRYYTDVTQADSDLGAVLEIARRELGENLIVVFTSDHGAQWPFGKWNLYDEGIRVPLLISWPGHVAPQTRTPAMVSWIDLLPTVIDLVGGNAPADIDGRSFAPVLRDTKTPHREEIFTTHNNDGRANVYPIRSLRTERWKYIRNLEPGWIHSTHSDRFRKADAANYFPSWEKAAETNLAAAFLLNRYRQRPGEELYDLAADPDELNNLAADARHAATVVELRTRLDAWMKSQNDPGSSAIKPKPWLPGTPGLVEPNGK